MLQTLDLNGTWDVGLDREYGRQVQVPGLAGDPATITLGTLWYRRKVTLPAGEWTHATLVLNGARFRPQVWVNGQKVSESEGGMAPTLHPLVHAAVRPGETVTVEIALASLADVPMGDASRIPETDRWRSNVASCLWDDVTLHVGDSPLTRLERPASPGRDFRVVGKHFQLNGEPVQLRAATVVWHRWCRDPEVGPTGLAWDAAWFERHVITPAKERGCNAIRFHLGLPPERLLTLCDKHGLMVQAEWSFFHNMDGSAESLRRQYRAGLDMLSRHPSVVLFHAWNEHEGPEIETAMAVLREIRPEYPQFAFSYLEVMHPHKYWWSLFENVGVYYDSADEFPMAIMVDEFGGNYLDGDGNPGAYPTVKESMLRFLGRGHTKEQRLELHTLANARVAEYWRRLGGGGPAGFSPFAVCGSREDGNHWYVGPIADGKLKPVWDALTAAWAARSVSLDLWDRNFEPGERRRVDLHFFNDTAREATLVASVSSVGAVTAVVGAHGRAVVPVEMTLPETAGRVELSAEMRSANEGVTRPVVSSWPVQVISPRVPEALRGVAVGVPEGEGELRAMLERAGVAVGGMESRVIVTSRATYERGGAGFAQLEAAIRAGRGVVMLDAGPRPLGEGYPDPDITRNLQGQPQVAAKTEETPLFLGLTARFRRMPEPESCIHPSEEAASAALWQNLPRAATQLWNGLRGGLIVPASDMELVGLAPDAFVGLWTSRGAEAEAITSGGAYFAFELAGFYAFDTTDKTATKDALRQRVKFLVDDAPALALSINPAAPIRTFNLAAMYRASQGGMARRLVALVNAGKNLTRVPVVKVEFGGDVKGRLVLSQLLTAGRLARGFAPEATDRYPIRYDPAAAQFVLNMIAAAVGT